MNTQKVLSDTNKYLSKQVNKYLIIDIWKSKEEKL